MRTSLPLPNPHKGNANKTMAYSPAALAAGDFFAFPCLHRRGPGMRKRGRSMDVITPLHPQKRLRHLHVIARSGAAAPRRGNPFSLQWHITKRNTLGKSAAVYEFALNAAYFPLSLRGYGLPRRFAPRNHHVFSHHDKRKCDILEAWQKFAVISPIWKINYYLNKLQNLGWQPPNICYGLSIILPKKPGPVPG